MPEEEGDTVTGKKCTAECNSSQFSFIKGAQKRTGQSQVQTLEFPGLLELCFNSLWEVGVTRAPHHMQKDCDSDMAVSPTYGACSTPVGIQSALAFLQRTRHTCRGGFFFTNSFYPLVPLSLHD